jgi:hypothetical protein
MMKLLPNEEKLVSSNDDKIVLTNHRIQMTDSVWGQSYTISISLENISSIEIKYKSNIILLVLGALSVLAGLYAASENRDSDSMLGGIALGLGFFALWWFTRKHIVSISSNGGSSLDFMVQGMGEERIADFIYKVSLAKQARTNQLAKL